jgi:cytochrome oxidase Cu insertion factor (SCO1/SenC/PrrC family)
MNTVSRIRLFLCATALIVSAAADPGTSPARAADHDYAAPAPGTYELPVIKPAADGKVLDHKGRARNLADLTKGRVTVLSFIYTRCASVKACPMATGVLNQLHRASEADPALAKNLRLISMSFDPSADTPERMAAYSNWAGNRQNSADWHFLTTRSQADLQPILDAYGQAVARRSNPIDPLGPLNHTLRVYLIDAAGQIRNIYSSGTLDPRLVLADIKTLLLEKTITVGSAN